MLSQKLSGQLTYEDGVDDDEGEEELDQKRGGVGSKDKTTKSRFVRELVFE